MPRIRTVKPEIALHEKLFDLEQETGLPIRFCWAVFPCHCDREGRFDWRPRSLGAQILPYDQVDFSRVLDAWVTRGFIVKYRVDDAWYGWLPTFKKHQVINNREKESERPPIEQCDELIDHRKQEVNDASGTRESRVDYVCGTRVQVCKEERKGKEGKGKEGKGINILLGSNFELSESEENNTTSNKPTIHHARQVLSFLNSITGKNFEDVDSNLKPIKERLTEAAKQYKSIDNACLLARRVCIDRKNEWIDDQKYKKYLRPATLFNKTKFWNYAGDLPDALTIKTE